MRLLFILLLNVYAVENDGITTDVIETSKEQGKGMPILTGELHRIETPAESDSNVGLDRRESKLMISEDRLPTLKVSTSNPKLIGTSEGDMSKYLSQGDITFGPGSPQSGTLIPNHLKGNTMTSSELERVRQQSRSVVDVTIEEDAESVSSGRSSQESQNPPDSQTAPQVKGYCPLGQEWSGLRCAPRDCPEHQQWSTLRGRCVSTWCEQGLIWSTWAGKCISNNCPMGEQPGRFRGCVPTNCQNDPDQIRVFTTISSKCECRDPYKILRDDKCVLPRLAGYQLKQTKKHDPSWSPCEIGMYRADGESRCKKCPIGSFSNEWASAQCQECKGFPHQF